MAQNADVVVAIESKASEVLTQSPSFVDALPLPHHVEDETTAQDDRSTLLKSTVFSATQPDQAHSTPWYAWPLLGASLLAVSSAAVVFASIPDVPTFTLAAWRLQLTTLLLAPAAIHQYRQLTTGEMPCFAAAVLHLCTVSNSLMQTSEFADETRRLWKDVLLILASGAFLAVHFSCWVWVSASVSSCYQECSLGLTSALDAAMLYYHIIMLHLLLLSLLIPYCIK